MFDHKSTVRTFQEHTSPNIPSLKASKAAQDGLHVDRRDGRPVQQRDALPHQGCLGRQGVVEKGWIRVNALLKG
jgi:hypothetical protein